MLFRSSVGLPGAGGDAPEASSGPVLQSILITPTRRSAIISGELVAQGGKFRDARVVRITDSEVVLRTGRNQETLKLFPGVEKRGPQSAATEKGNKSGQRGQGGSR